MTNKNYNTVFDFPSQTISDSNKNEQWGKDCIDAAESVITTDSSVIRQSFHNKKVNYNLRNGRLTESDIKEVCSPYGDEFSSFPKNMQHIGLANSKINILIGEEAKKLTRYPFTAYLSSTDDMGISSKEDGMRNMVYQRLVELIQQKDLDEEQIEIELQELQKYLRYSYQDLSEIYMNKILKFEYLRLDVKDKLLQAWEDFLICGEAIFCIEESGGDISIRKVNPMYLITVQSPDSYKVEDSEMIMEYTMMPIGNIVDLYYKDLTTTQIKNLEHFRSNKTGRPGTRMLNNADLRLEDYYAPGTIDDAITAGSWNSSSYDHRGNIRVIKICWKSKRQLQEITYFDEDGIQQTRIEDEYYKIDKDLGETSTKFFINEWWEGTKISDDIYCKIRPIPYQGRSLVNLSEATPPYVGIYCNTNNSKVNSFLDVCKPLDYLYDIFHHRMNLASAKYKGPMLAINASMVPDGWDPKMWIKYGDATGYLWMDPTNEILKGPSQGKSAGVFNQLTANGIDQNMGNYIQSQVEMLMFIKQEMDLISGVNDARQGDPSKTTATANQMAWSASNSATEKYISLFQQFKTNVMRKILQVSKYVWSLNPEKKAQFVLDDMGVEFVKSFEDIADREFDLHCADNANIEELMASLKQLAHAGMQTGQIRFKDIIAMYNKESVAALTRYLEQAEDEVAQQVAASQQADQDFQAQMQEAQSQLKQAEFDLEYFKIENDNMNKQLDREAKIQSDVIKALGFSQETDVNNNQIPDVMEQGKLALENIKVGNEVINKQKENELKQRAIESQEKIKKLEIESKERIEKQKAKTAEMKAKSDEKIATTNRNKYSK